MFIMHQFEWCREFAVQFAWTTVHDLRHMADGPEVARARNLGISDA